MDRDFLRWTRYVSVVKVNCKIMKTELVNLKINVSI